MKNSLLLLLLALTSCRPVYYVVRHAEKALPAPNMGSDVPLTAEGEQRAGVLKEILKDKKIAFVYSTNTIRTKSTAQPTASYFGLGIQIYGPKPDSAFIALLKSKPKNTLVVGHSNTVDDIVNMLCGKAEINGDLPETDYDNLYIIRKKGGKYIFRGTTYGKPTQ